MLDHNPTTAITNHLVCIFRVDIVLNCLLTGLAEVLGGDLDKVGNFCLQEVRAGTSL